MGRKKRKASVLPMPKIKHDPDEVENNFCPPTMYCYDNTLLEYSPIWICKICMTLLISEKGVKEHVLRCNMKLFREKIEPEIELFNPKYECDVCKKIFKRLVILQKHELNHVKPKEEEDYEEEVPCKKRRRRRSKKKQADKKILKSQVPMQKPILDHVKPKEEEDYEEDVPCKKRRRRCSKKMQVDKMVSPLKIKLEIGKEKL